VKRLLGVLLVLRVVECGVSVAKLEELGADIKRNHQGDIVQVRTHDSLLIKDADLVHLKRMINQQTLSLPRRITDAELVHLKGLTKLEVLGLDSGPLA